MREKSAALEFGALILELGLKGIEVAPHVAQRLRYGRREIAIFGPGGSGKTTLATFLAGKPVVDSTKRRYVRSTVGGDTERFEGRRSWKIRAVPGQIQDFKNDWVQVLERVSSGKAHGIINVVSWGYHALDQQRYEDTSYYVPGMSQQEFLSVYLNTRRQEEINVAGVLADELEDNFNLLLSLHQQSDQLREAIKNYRRLALYRYALIRVLPIVTLGMLFSLIILSLIHRTIANYAIFWSPVLVTANIAALLGASRFQPLRNRRGRFIELRTQAEQLDEYIRVASSYEEHVVRSSSTHGMLLALTLARAISSATSALREGQTLGLLNSQHSHTSTGSGYN